MTQAVSPYGSTRTMADLPNDSYVSFTVGSKVGLKRKRTGVKKHHYYFCPPKIPQRETGILLSSPWKLNSNVRTKKILQFSQYKPKEVLCFVVDQGGWTMEAQILWILFVFSFTGKWANETDGAGARLHPSHLYLHEWDSNTYYISQQLSSWGSTR